jgi:hypothetical protein
MKTIYKYELEPVQTQTVTLPKGAQLLSVINQFGKAMLYALVDNEETEEDYAIIHTVGTGHEAPFNFRFLSTVAFLDGKLIFHFFGHI